MGMFDWLTGGGAQTPQTPQQRSAAYATDMGAAPEPKPNVNMNDIRQATARSAAGLEPPGGWNNPATGTPPPAAPKVGMWGRAVAELPTLRKGFGALGTAAKFGGKFIPGAAQAIGIGAEGVGVMDKILDPEATKMDVLARAGEGAGRLGAMGAGAGIGAAMGSVVPVVGTAIGGALGGAAGYFGAGALMDRMRNGPSPSTAPTGPAEGAGLAQDQTQSAQVGGANTARETDVNARIAAAVDEANTKSMWGAVNQYRAGQTPQMAPNYDSYYAAQSRGQGGGDATLPPRTQYLGYGASPERRSLPVGEGRESVRTGAVGQFAGDMLRLGMMRQEANRGLKQQQLNQDYQLKLPGTEKDRAEMGSIRARQALAMKETDPKVQADILAGRAVAHAPPALAYPETLQPPPGVAGGGYAVGVSRDPNKPGAMRIPIREQIRGAQGTDGNYYKTDAAGKQVKMTDAEKAQFIAQKRGAVQ